MLILSSKQIDGFIIRCFTAYMYSIFDSYVHKHYICFKAGDCRLLASVGVYSYYVKRKKSTSSIITCNWHFIWTDVWSEYRGVVGLMKDTGIQMCFQNFIKWQRASVKISHMIRKIVLLELIISKEVEVFQKITILKKLEVRGFGALFHAPPLDPPVVCIPESACKYSSNARNVPPPPV